MAKKKIYAVRKGHKTGLFETWAECQKATSGYSGAEFRGFTDREEAMAFLQISTTANVSKDEEKEAAGIVEVPENMVIAERLDAGGALRRGLFDIVNDVLTVEAAEQGTLKGIVFHPESHLTHTLSIV